MDWGLIYKMTAHLQFSLVNRNLFHFGENRHSNAAVSSFEKDVKFSFPDYYTVGFAWKSSYYFYWDNEIIAGKYGGKKLKYMEFWFMRMGMEKKLKSWSFRSGITIPVLAESSSLGNLLKKIPSPKLNIALGLGYKFASVIFDSAVFFNPGLSYANQKPVPDISFSLGYEF
jgi:hypothetical protein